MVMFASQFTDPISRHAQQLLDPVTGILSRPEDFGATPGILPSPGKPQRLPSALGVPSSRSRAATPIARETGPSIPDLILGQVRRLGPVGRGVDRVLSPVADFAGEVGAAGRRAARTGALAGVAPNFTQGVLAGDANSRAEIASNLNRQLIESQVGLNQAQAAGGAGTRNVQSTQTDADGNLILVRRDGTTENTGIQVGRRSSIETLADGTIIQIDPFTGDRRILLSPEQAAEAASRGAEQRAETVSAETQAREDVGKPQELRAQIAKDQQFIDQAEGFLRDFEVGRLQTGPIIGKFPALSGSGQAFESFAGQNVINLISEATFGQLSEGERKFLETVSFGRDLNEGVNVEKLERAIEIVRGAQDRARGEISRIEGTSDTVLDFNDLPP